MKYELLDFIVHQKIEKIMFKFFPFKHANTIKTIIFFEVYSHRKLTEILSFSFTLDFLQSPLLCFVAKPI
jgi:hypothetical protein